MRKPLKESVFISDAEEISIVQYILIDVDHLTQIVLLLSLGRNSGINSDRYLLVLSLP